MTLLAGSFYLICTAAFALLSFVIGARMIGLSKKTGQTPEFLLGMSLMLTACLGYGLLITAGVLRPTAPDTSRAGLAAMTMIGKMLHNVGVMCMLGFVMVVFRPGVVWARFVAGAFAAVLWIGFAGVCLTGGLEHGEARGFWYWFEFSVIGTYPIWTCVESLRFYSIMKKRQGLGLAEPLIVNRFLLWGLGSVFSTAAIWTVTLPALLNVEGMGPRSEFMATCMIVTSLLGTISVSMSWMTFFPPKWYADRISAGSTTNPA